MTTTGTEPVAAWTWGRAVVTIALVAGACLASACISRSVESSSIPDFLIRKADPKAPKDEPSPFIDPAARPPKEAFQDYTRQLRTVHGTLTPQPKTDSTASVESASVVLKQLLAALDREPTGAQHRAVAQEYRRLGILDQAYTHLTRAIALDPRDAVAYDLRARLWREWDLPQLGITDANRAVFYAPRSAAAWNTLGTLLHVSGQLDQAERIYRRALSFDGGARYVWTNLCRLHRRQGRDQAAADACARAVAPPSARAFPGATSPVVSRAVVDEAAEIDSPTAVDARLRSTPDEAARTMRALLTDPARRPVLHAAPSVPPATTMDRPEPVAIGGGAQ